LRALQTKNKSKTKEKQEGESVSKSFNNQSKAQYIQSSLHLFEETKTVAWK
jgi:hypothetical protein